MRMRKKKNIGPRLESCASVHIKEPENYRGRWSGLLPDSREVYLELGCGKGRFTAGTAETIPETLIVAIERVQDALIIAMERAVKTELKNVFFISADAELLPEYFEENEISRIYINFCDPWPTKRHAKRRLTAPGFLELYKNVLKPGGEIHFKTDNLPLFEYSLQQVAANGFELFEVTRNLHENGVCGVMTDYEAKFHEQGLPINRCVARRREK